MSAITIRFQGIYDEILASMLKTRLVESKTEALRLALFSFAIDRGLLADKTILRELRRELRKDRRSPEEVLSGIEDAKRNAIRR